MELFFKLMLFCSFFNWQASSLLTMKFKVGNLKYAKFVIKTVVPTIYQCAEICLLFKACTYFHFEKRTNKCYISKTSEPRIHVLPDYKYMAREDIPQELAGSCANHTCGYYEICIRQGKSSYMCQSLYQCIDGHLEVESNCNHIGNLGGCEQANIGKNLTKTGHYVYSNYPEYLFNLMVKFCDRKCKKCLQIF